MAITAIALWEAAWQLLLLDHCRNTWQVEADEVIDYHWLRDRFALFVQRLGRG